MKALIDTNVLIDVVQMREPFYKDSKKIFQMAIDETIEGYVSVQSLRDVFYVCKEKYKSKDPFLPIEQLAYLFNIIDVTSEDSISALMSGQEDYEDALLIFSAERNDLDAIITRNTKDFYDTDLFVIDPSEIDKIFEPGIRSGKSVVDLKCGD
ncbi:PIN domain protein [Candidatus Methanoplasma termitum]|uniref:PIN domain protein n=1 Tax=Candidatus Methanoplasma termitum TaxID=1577791 RepID=A0A0A7LB69_9ARCH|nr:PIN domain-containing protein [Candidatus Methanoplasma termitum]AIZ56319.1 PIN domain protein [Candidatus Methanoplasma termitum]MCL2334312.1 PIN domain-containing protein [Candidatus Methanoplasma sp.]